MGDYAVSGGSSNKRHMKSRQKCVSCLSEEFLEMDENPHQGWGFSRDSEVPVLGGLSMLSPGL
jgi:hypothetical protein